MHVAALALDLHVPQSRSLKAKRAVVKPVVEGVRRRFNVAVAEVGYDEQWQRARVGVAVVAATPAHATEVLDAVERYVWGQPELEVVSAERSWVGTA